MPAAEAVQDKVAVPEPATLLGVTTVQLSPLGTVTVRLTVPANPLTAVIVKVEGTDAPTVEVAGEVAAVVKSVTLNVVVAE